MPCLYFTSTRLFAALSHCTPPCQPTSGYALCRLPRCVAACGWYVVHYPAGSLLAFCAPLPCRPPCAEGRSAPSSAFVCAYFMAIVEDDVVSHLHRLPRTPGPARLLGHVGAGSPPRQLCMVPRGLSCVGLCVSVCAVCVWRVCGGGWSVSVGVPCVSGSVCSCRFPCPGCGPGRCTTVLLGLSRIHAVGRRSDYHGDWSADTDGTGRSGGAGCRSPFRQVPHF